MHKNIIALITAILVLNHISVFACDESMVTEMRVELVTKVKEYVNSTRDWNETQYSISYLHTESGLFIYKVEFHEDMKAQYPGGGQSFEVYVDPKESRVVKEMRYQ